MTTLFFTEMSYGSPSGYSSMFREWSSSISALTLAF